MTTDFKTTLKPILTIGKLFGLMNISYTIDSTGLLMRNTNSIYYSFLELTRMIVMIICTYIVRKREFYYIQEYRVIKFWIIIIAARITEFWIIK